LAHPLRVLTARPTWLCGVAFHGFCRRPDMKGPAGVT